MIIKIYQNVFNEELLPNIFEADNLGAWLLEHYGQTPEFPIDLYVGEPDEHRCITGDIQAILNAKDAFYSIIEKPAAANIGFWAFAQLFLTAVSIVDAAFSKPGTVMPPNVNRGQKSANNSFGDRTNQPRLFQRVEDIYGEVLSVPSEIASAWNYYDSYGNKFERGAYCIGRGYYDIETINETIKDSTTLIADIPDSGLSVYYPYTIPNGNPATPVLNIGTPLLDTIDTRIKNKNVNGIALRALNEITINGKKGYAFYANIIVQYDQTPPFSAVFSAGDQVEVVMPYDYGCGSTNSVDYYIPAGSVVDPHSAFPSGILSYNAPIGAYIDYVQGQLVAEITASKVSDVSFTMVSPFTLYIGDILRGYWFVGTSQTPFRFKIMNIVGTLFTINTGIVPNSLSQIRFAVYINYSGTYTVQSLEFSPQDSPEWSLFETGSWSKMLLTTSPFNRPVPVRRSIGSSFIDNLWPLINGIYGLTDIFLNAVITKINPDDEWTSWFKIINNQQTKILLNLAALQGLYKKIVAASGNSGPINISIDNEFEIQALVGGSPSGGIFSQSLSVASNEGDQATGASLLVDLQALLGNIGSVQIRARRITSHDYQIQGTVVDEVLWEAVYSVIPITVSHFGYKTCIFTETKLNQKALSIQNRELNVIAARLLPTWNGSVWSGVLNTDGTIASGTLNKTKNPTDIMAAITQDRKIGNRALNTLDIAQIVSVIATINTWNSNCSEFSYTFDSDTITYEKHLNIIATAIFSQMYYQNSKFRLAFDGPQAVSTGIVTHRSKKPGAVDTISRTFFQSSLYDGIQMVYVDPDTLKTETFYLPLDGNFTKAQKIEIPGIRNFTQAWFRANREFKRLFNQRLGIRTEMTQEARAFAPNARIDIVDNTRFKSYSGEVVGYNATTLTVTLSDPVVFKSGQNHTLVLAKRNGEPNAISCLAGATPYEVVLMQQPTETPVVVSGIDGIRTIYSFAADTDRAAMAYRIKSIDYASQPPYASVEAVRYDPDDYAADSQSVPNRSSVIGA